MRADPIGAKLTIAVISLLKGQLAEARAGMAVTIQPGYQLTVAAPHGPLLATIVADDGDPIVTMATVTKSLHAVKMWEMLETLGATGAPPSAPWCAAALHPAASLHLGAMTWLGDFERALAWTWIES